MKTGQILGGYRIVASLGAGGMGEVWRAEDSKLGREVALKLLPQDVSADADRLARFEREAKVLASLNHPNIAHLYDLQTDELDQGSGDSDDIPSSASADPPAASHPVTFLVMELVEGEDLSDLISRGRIPVDNAVRIGRQIAEAVEAAHEQNIVHRDLKPANIKIRTDGTVKVLDFGLAKTWQADSGDASLSLSPTMTKHATAAGMILGTAAYMSPEQAAGTDADRRADIWALGVVLWEMLTGHRLFDGETVSHVLASVLKDQVDLDELPPTLPTRLRELIKRCLERDPKRRLQAIGEARVVFEDLEQAPESMSGVMAPAPADHMVVPSRTSRLPWAVAAVATTLLAVATGVGVWLTQGADSEPSRVTRAHVLPPKDSTFTLEAYAPACGVISPDGSRLVFGAAGADGRKSLWVRRLDELAARPLPGTTDASFPFWSPDSRHIAFFADRNLRKIDTTGGPPVTICSAPNGKGGTWNDNGKILFAPMHNTGIHIVAAAGGESKELIKKPDGVTSHRFPHWLPNDRFLYLARSSEGPEHDRLMVASVEQAGPGRELLAAPSNAAAAAGQLLFIREDTLMAQPFDSSSAELVGDAVPVAENVLYLSAARYGAFSTSHNGVLIYNTGSMLMHSEVAWADRSGTVTANIGSGDLFFDVKLSPGGRSAAVVELESSAGTSDIWVYDLERGLRTRFTFDANNDWYPAWSADGSMIAFANSRSGDDGQIWTKQVGGAGVAELAYTEDEHQLFPLFWSPDGQWLVYERVDGTNNADLWAMPSGGGEAEALIASTFDESHAAISPDGRWMAFVSNESGSNEVYVTTFPEPARRWQISTDGGSYPRWDPDGKEIFFIAASGDLVANDIDGSGPSLRVGESTELFSMSLSGVFRYPYDVAAGGERILLIRAARPESSDPIAVVVNWDAELSRESR